jgi:hypothetical protein
VEIDVVEQAPTIVVEVATPGSIALGPTKAMPEDMTPDTENDLSYVTPYLFWLALNEYFLELLLSGLVDFEVTDEIEDGITLLEAFRRLQGQILTKQNLLVSGTNIKTLNGQNLLGAGNISIAESEVISGAYKLGNTYYRVEVSDGIYNTNLTPINPASPVFNNTNPLRTLIGGRYYTLARYSSGSNNRWALNYAGTTSNSTYPCFAFDDSNAFQIAEIRFIKNWNVSVTKLFRFGFQPNTNLAPSSTDTSFPTNGTVAMYIDSATSQIVCVIVGVGGNVFYNTGIFTSVWATNFVAKFKIEMTSADRRIRFYINDTLFYTYIVPYVASGVALTNICALCWYPASPATPDDTYIDYVKMVRGNTFPS